MKPVKPFSWLVVVAFATVYVVWGSTYFFIQVGLDGFPPMILGALRFIAAGLILLTWCYFRGQKLFDKRTLKTSAISGIFTLFIANGIVFYVETFLPSAMVAIMVSANPIWFVILDRPNWKINFRSRTTLAGLAVGFGGVVLLFGEAFARSAGTGLNAQHMIGLLLLVLGPIAWAGGSLYSKRVSKGVPAGVNTGWQMMAAGVAFIPAGFIRNEYTTFDISTVPVHAWMALAYLVVFGSVAAFSAYVWLMQVRPATQVSTHAYVNPVVAVLLGVFFAGENISWLQVDGLVIILVSVLLVNMAKYSSGKVSLNKASQPVPVKTSKPVPADELCGIDS